MAARSCSINSPHLTGVPTKDFDRQLSECQNGKRCAQFVTEKADINIGTAPGKESKCEARGLLGTDEVNDSTLAADLFKNSRNYLRGLAVRCKTAP